ncbi:head-tail joining protein [Cereibacter changlensis]|uniref:head-tail joining protein n=1 Tax=Cereibacter changlensis TaxID=402884 RepID=UPI00403403E9
MAAVFSGMTRIGATVFGAPVRYLPAAGAPREVQSVFREAPIEAVDPDGHPVLIVTPTWRVAPALVPELARGDRIEPGNGKTYAVQTIQPSGSAALDAAVICELERLLFP